ncbi:MAG: hypothetical protein HOE30_25420 [Deltaproteobacteria bacterium]|nr:hypothetical protein [Deltaproteobacteria bacterium]
MIEKKHGSSAVNSYRTLNEPVVEKAQQYDQDTIRGLTESTYKDSERVLNDDNLEMTDKSLKIPGYDKPVNLELTRPYPDMNLD